MTENQEATAQTNKNFIAKWIGVYFSPAETFKSLDEKPDWVVPLLLSAIIVALTTVFTFMIPEVIDSQIEALMDMRDMSFEKAEKAMQIAKYFAPIQTFIVVLILGFIFAGGLYMISSFFLGGESTYKKVLSVYSYTALAVTLVAVLVRIPLMFIKKSAEIQTSLAAFLSPELKGDFIYRLFAQLDIFLIWQVILWTIGLGIIYRFSRGKAAIASISVSVVYVIIAVLLSGLAGGAGS